jgi:hypothetical protein
MYSAIHCFIPQIIDKRGLIVRRILVGGFSERRGLPPDSASKTIGIDGVKLSTGGLSAR